MSWFFVDDRFFSCIKLGLIPEDALMPAVGLWTIAGSWSRNVLSGGEIPYHQVTRLGGTHEQAGNLVKCGLWEPCDAGYRFHDWAEWQETPEEVAHKRAEGKKRAKRWREKKKAKEEARKRNAVTRGERRANAERSNASVTPSVPGEGEGDGTYGGKLRERDTQGFSSFEELEQFETDRRSTSETAVVARKAGAR